MKISTSLAVAAVCLLGASACHQATSVRGPGDQMLTATTPRAITLRRGETLPVQIGIDRTNFTGPVTVSLSQLPKGVDADDKSMTVETTNATFILRASSTADLVTNQAVAVTVEGPEGRRTTHYIDLTVKD